MALSRTFRYEPERALDAIFKEKTDKATYQFKPELVKYYDAHYATGCDKVAAKVIPAIRSRVQKVPNSDSHDFEALPFNAGLRFTFDPHGIYIEVCAIRCDSYDVFEHKDKAKATHWKEVQKAAEFEVVAKEFKPLLQQFVKKDASFRVLYWTFNGWGDTKNEVCELKFCIFIPDDHYVQEIIDNYLGRDKDKDPGVHSDSLDPKTESEVKKLFTQFLNTYKKYTEQKLTKAMRTCFEWGKGTFGDSWRGDLDDLVIFEFDWQSYLDDDDPEMPKSIASISDEEKHYDAFSNWAWNQLAFKGYAAKFKQIAEKVNPKYYVEFAGDEQYRMWLGVKKSAH